MATLTPLLSRLLLALVLLLALQRRAGAIVVPVSVGDGDDGECMSAQELQRNASLTEYPSNIPPCKTLNRALGNEICTSCSVAEPLADFVFELTSGTYHLEGCIGIVGGSNITIQSSSRDAFIECETFPNNIVENYDNIYICGTSGIAFRGLQFTRCGPQSPNVFLNASSGILFDNCTFTNNTGSSLQVQFCDDITLRRTRFISNENQLEAEPDVNETSIEELYNSITTSGGFTFFSRSQPVSIVIEHCMFLDNSANRNDPNNTRPVLLKANGHGGAVLIRLAEVRDSEIIITDNIFRNNRAQVDGGAIYISLSDSVASNSFLLARNNFMGNIVEEASGGAVSINSFNISFNNSILVEDCNFTGNVGNAGGAFSVALYDSNINSTRNPDSMSFTNCRFYNNAAENEGTAVGLFSLVHVDQVGFPVGFENCSFRNNTSEGTTKDTSAIAAFRFPIVFTGTNTFISNVGGGVTLLNTQMKTSGVMLFDRNTAVFGGGIAMDDRCLLELSPGTTLSFTNNEAMESGGGIYVEFPPIRFVVDIFNRLCFLQYNDLSGRDVPPQEWQDISINFTNNTARLSGAAIYASDMQQCGWLGNVTSDSTLIFNLPEELAARSPFFYSNNRLFSESDNAPNADLATAPSTIDIDTDYTLVQPGESLAISLLAKDQVNNSREAVWSLEAPNQEVNLDALSANRDTYVYEVPCAPCLNDTDMPECTCSSAEEGDGTTVTEMFSATINLNFSLLRTLGEINSLRLEVDGCHPGYTYNEDTGECECATDNSNILRCDDNNRYLYLREGIWGGTEDVNGVRSLITARVQPGYVNCRPQGRLPGCLFEFDNPDRQCRSERKGRLCGTCINGYGVTLDLQSCDQECDAGLPVFIILCVCVIAASLLIMFFDIELPNELKGFLFYAQVIGLVYRPFAVVQTSTSALSTFLSILVNLLGFSLPFPLCLSPNVPAHYVALLGYISPILAMITVAGYIISAKFSKHLSNRSALKGITFLSLFIYKYIADTVFIFISCTDTQFGLVFQYDGSVTCTSAEFGVFSLIGLILVAFFVTPAPFAISYICIRRPQKFQHYADVLTKGLRPRHRWWGGWDIGRRLPFVFIGFFLVLLRPSLVLFLMSLAALAVLIVHLFVKPYEKMYINVIETAILLNLLMVSAAFLDPSNSPVPEWFSTILVLLPYCYAVGYISWRVGEHLWKRFGARILRPREPSTTVAPPPNKEDLNIQQGERVTGPSTAGSSPPNTASDPITASTRVSSDAPSSATPVPSPPRPAVESEPSFTQLREPLLDS